MDFIGIIYTDADDFNHRIRLRELYEVGKFFNAWLAPCRPDIKKKNPSSSFLDKFVQSVLIYRFDRKRKCLMKSGFCRPLVLIAILVARSAAAEQQKNDNEARTQ
jgi:hypothetical protein